MLYTHSYCLRPPASQVEREPHAPLGHLLAGVWAVAHWRPLFECVEAAAFATTHGRPLRRQSPLCAESSLRSRLVNCLTSTLTQAGLIAFPSGSR
jgi:hypothetical protein